MTRLGEEAFLDDPSLSICTVEWREAMAEHLKQVALAERKPATTAKPRAKLKPTLNLNTDPERHAR